MFCEMKGSFWNKKLDNFGWAISTLHMQKKKGQFFYSEVWIQPRAMIHHGFIVDKT